MSPPQSSLWDYPRKSYRCASNGDGGAVDGLVKSKHAGVETGVVGLMLLMAPAAATAAMAEGRLKVTLRQ